MMAAVSSNEESVFKALKYAGEKFFDHKNALDAVKSECEEICERSRQQFNNVKENIPTDLREKQMVNDELFDNLKLDETEEIKFEKRRECTEEEIDMIKTACKDKNVPLQELEDIKFALGFKAIGKERYEFKKPLMALVGQTKAGKSSLINCLLRERVVPQKVSKQTARVTYVTHSKTKFVAHMKNNCLIKIQLDTDVKDQDVDLKFDDRIDSDKVNVEIRVGRPNSVLQNGFDIVDSPGLNENPALNDLCKKMEKSLLPLLIYVIDGRNGLTQTDINDIKKINENTPQLTILYFVTKLDRSKYDRLMYQQRKKENGLSPGEEIDGETDFDVARRRLEKVFDKLKSNSFVSNQSEMEDCIDFNGANLWLVNEIRIKRQVRMPINDLEKFNIDMIEKFEERLMSYLKSMLESPLKENLKVIFSSLESSLEKASTIASKIAGEKLEKRNCLDAFVKNEQNLYKEQKKYMTDTLKSQINKMIEENSIKFNQILEMIFARNTSHFSRQDSDEDFSEDFEKMVEKYIERSLNEEIMAAIKEFMISNEENLRKKLWELVKKLRDGKYGCMSFETMLKNRLFLDYELNEDSLDDKYGTTTRDNLSRKSKIKNSFKHLVDFIAKALCRHHRSSHAHSQIADSSNLFDSSSRENILNDISLQMTKEFENKHKKFNKELQSHQTILQQNFDVGDQEKKCVRLFAEEMSVQFAKLIEVKTPLSLHINHYKTPSFVGKGGQAKVNLVYLASQNEPIVRKTYTKSGSEEVPSDFEFASIQGKYSLADADESGKRRLINFGMEIYYSSRLDTPRFLKLLGIHLTSNSTFSAFYPYLKLGSMKQYLHNEKNRKLTVKHRLKFAIHIAEGLRHLHTLDIVHRDINLKNVLVRGSGDACSDDEAVICDYGFTKSFGFIDDSYRKGTTEYMAPELFNKAFSGYSHAIDVYSFAISLWKLLTFNLKDDYQYRPQFVLNCQDSDCSTSGPIKSTIEKLVIDGTRPERRVEIPDEIWKLMERCWDGKPSKRPSFTKPLKDISYDCDDDDIMRNKTILQVLEDCY